MKRETELNVLLPSRELLVKLVAEDRPLGLRASSPKKRVLLEIFFDTPEGSLREQGMTCRLCQMEGDLPAVVVTTGEGSEEGGVVSRTMMKASAVGTGIFETLRGDSEAARQVQNVADPLRLRPQVALNIRRLQRTVRGGLFFRPVFELFFDVVTVQVGGVAKSYQELHLQDLGPGGPEILDLVQVLRDRYHIFPDGLSTLQRGVRFLNLAREQLETVAAPVHVNVALVAISENRVALASSEHGLTIPTFRGAGEDAALALARDVTVDGNPSLTRLGSTEPGPDGAVLEIWTLATDSVEGEGGGVSWVPWHLLLEHTGTEGLTDPTLRWALLYLTHSAIEEMYPTLTSVEGKLPPELEVGRSSEGEPTSGPVKPEHEVLEGLYERLRTLEDSDTPLSDRIEGISDLSGALDEFFVKGPSMLTLPPAEELRAPEDGDALEDVEASVANRLDHICIRARGLTHRLRRLFTSELASELKDQGTRILQWSDLEDRQRDTMSSHLQEELAPRLSPVADETVDSLSLIGETTKMVVALRRSPAGDQTLLAARTIPTSVPTFLRAPISRDLLPLEEVFTENGHIVFPNEDVDMPFLVRITRCGITSPDEEDPATDSPPPMSGGTGAAPKAAPEPTGSDIGSALDVLRAGAGVIEHRRVGRAVAHPSLTRVEVPSAMPWATRTALLQSLGADPSGGQCGLVRTDLFEVEGPVELHGLKEALARPEGDGRPA